jgi:hypothetical protein
MKSVNELKAEYETLKRKLFTLKTKKAREKCRDKMEDILQESYLQVYEQCKQYTTCSVKCVVKYVDRDGELILDTPYGKVFTNSCNDDLSKSWYGTTCCVEYDIDQVVYLEVDFQANDFSIGVVAKKITGGTLNEEKYKKLCNDGNKYAFFKYPDSDDVTGLFG